MYDYYILHLVRILSYTRRLSDKLSLFFQCQAQAVHAQYLRLLALIQHYLSSKIATRISSRYFVFDYFEKILRLDVIHCLPIKSFMFFRFGVRNYIANKIILHTTDIGDIYISF